MAISLDAPAKKSNNGLKWLLSVIGTIGVIYFTISSSNSSSSFGPSTRVTELPPNPFKNITKFKPTGSRASEIYNDYEYRNKSLKFLQGAVKIPTELQEELQKPYKDLKGWEAFLDLHKYLESSFPLVFSKLKVTHVNELALLIEYEGSNPELKPLVLTAHQDVVPVDKDTLDRWTYPPFEAHYDGEILWGRGTADTKSLLISIFESFELLLQKNHKPNRTIILATSYDEEASNLDKGAIALAEFLKEKYGSIYTLIDEGTFISQVPGVPGHYIAEPSVAEKGYIDVLFELFVDGGHSSVPFDHSAIGIAADLVHLIENDPYKPTLTDENPIFDYLRTVAEIDEFDLSDELRENFIYARYDDQARERVVEYLNSSRLTKYLIKTSQSIDIINSGVKINAIPEYLKLGINHRIALDKTVDDVLSNLIDKAATISEKFNLNLSLENNTEIIKKEDSLGSFKLSWEQPINPPPVSSSAGTKAWEVLASSIKSTFEDSIALGSTVDVVPATLVAHTDASTYVELSKNVYRFTGNIEGFYNIHAIDEHIEFDAHIQQVAFLHDYILAVQEFDS
ncbi:hypothetical protein WICMUC_004957 [Wickerhamomyces mucosus]|uniref:Peptidase M20 dimerisation domain-containing protein n=1 Tax=Wickerhamomyces mucosus TaxID=1378264 RepID=A0A9P8PDE1_9ASCO|nr:hypothetical protein WICMUC_004957 [Wickerhamomyces mucosus]